MKLNTLIKKLQKIDRENAGKVTVVVRASHGEFWPLRKLKLEKKYGTYVFLH